MSPFEGHLVCLSTILFVLAWPLAVFADRQYTVVNSCPSGISLFINGVAQTWVASRGTFKVTQPDFWSGFIYTDANGGNQNGAGTTRAGFYGDNGYYYIVIDPAYLNVGVKITPVDQPAANGFCVSVSCTTLTCTTAFQTPPTRFPAPTNTPPNPPVYSCPKPSTGYTVEFCPGGAFPPPPTVTLHPNGNAAKCLDVRGAVYANGTPVQIYDCNGTGAQKWQLKHGSTKVRVAGTNYCLDAGSAPASGIGLKIWTCYDNLAAQAWYYTNDNRIAVENAGQCADLTNGVLTNSNQCQTWACTDNNLNQVWTSA